MTSLVNISLNLDWILVQVCSDRMNHFRRACSGWVLVEAAGPVKGFWPPCRAAVQNKDLPDLWAASNGSRSLCFDGARRSWRLTFWWKVFERSPALAHWHWPSSHLRVFEEGWMEISDSVTSAGTSDPDDDVSWDTSTKKKSVLYVEGYHPEERKQLWFFFNFFFNLQETKYVGSWKIFRRSCSLSCCWFETNMKISSLP